MVGEEMAEPVGPEFRLLFDQQNFGMPLPQALKAFADRIPILDARFFVTAVLTQREAGGNLSEVLDNLSSIIRDRFRVKRQVRVISAHGRITGWILSRASGQPGTLLRILEPGDVPQVLHGSVRDQDDCRSRCGCRLWACSSFDRSCRSSTERDPGALTDAAAESRAVQAMIHRSTVVLIAVFASVALGVGALVSFALTWSDARAARDPAALAARSDGVLAQLNLHGNAQPLGEAVPAGRAEVAERDDSASRRRLASAGYRSLGRRWSMGRPRR